MKYSSKIESVSLQTQINSIFIELNCVWSEIDFIFIARSQNFEKILYPSSCILRLP